MKLFDVYPLLPLAPVRAQGCHVWTAENKYLDLYGGHAVISIGHSHKEYVQAITKQVKQIGFYSNSVQNPLQNQLAELLGEVSGYPDYQLFLVNSGAEAIENAVKLASFHTGKKKVVALKNGFHGRTSLAVGITDNPRLQAQVNQVHDVDLIAINDEKALTQALSKNDVAAVVIEGIQGIAGIYEPSSSFLQKARELCDQTGTLLIIDEIQSGYGRTGKFFAHQHTNIKADMITVAKGMGNGFPMGGVLISPEIKPKHGLLGTTFGGAHLAAAAGIAVLKVIAHEQLVENSANIGDYLKQELLKLPVKEIRGKGLMLGLEFDYPVSEIRKELLGNFHIFTGTAANPNVLRILPPLCLNKDQAQYFVRSLKNVLANTQ